MDSRRYIYLRRSIPEETKRAKSATVSVITRRMSVASICTMRLFSLVSTIYSTFSLRYFSTVSWKASEMNLLKSTSVGYYFIIPASIRERKSVSSIR